MRPVTWRVAPPRRSASPAAVSEPPLCPATKSHASAPITTAEPVISITRVQGDGESEKTPNAIPGFRLCTRYMKLWTSSRCQPSNVCASNQALLPRSRITIPSVSHNQRSRRGTVNSGSRTMLDIRPAFRLRASRSPAAKLFSYGRLKPRKGLLLLQSPPELLCTARKSSDNACFRLRAWSSSSSALFLLRGHIHGTIPSFSELGHVHAFGIAFRFGQESPDLLGGENKNRRDQPHQPGGDFPDGRLRRAPRFIFRRLGVQPVFQDVV